jgi:hypothetical protein
MPQTLYGEILQQESHLSGTSGMIDSRTLDYLYSYGSVSALSLYLHECKTDGVSHACARASCFVHPLVTDLSDFGHAQGKAGRISLTQPPSPRTKQRRSRIAIAKRAGRAARRAACGVNENHAVQPAQRQIAHRASQSPEELARDRATSRLAMARLRQHRLQSAGARAAPAGAPEMEDSHMDVLQDRRIGGAAVGAVDPIK